MHILIVEDDDICCQLMEEIVSVYGEYQCARNGQDGVDAFKCAWENNTPFDLIFLDIMLPEMDGQEVLKEIRSWENMEGIHGKDGVKIIMVTALGDSSNILKAFNSQCEHYLVKPVTPEKVFDAMKKIGAL